MSTSYTHPYISIQIYDDTEYTEEEVTTTRQTFNGLQVGFFAGGRDNQLLYMDNRTQYLREYGNPNFKKFGQAAYNVDNALATGNCGMYIMNLRPDTATYANAVIMVKFKLAEISEDTEEATENTTEDETATLAEPTESTPATKLMYSFYAKYIEGATTEDILLTSALALMESEPDKDGYYNMPLMTVYSQGRGEYGNSIRLAFSNVSDYDDVIYSGDLARTTYAVTVMEPSSSGLVEKEITYGTFDVDAFDASIDYGPSLYMPEIVNDLENGSERIRMEAYEATINTMMALYNTIPDVTPIESAGAFDIISGISVDGTTNENLYLDTTPDNYLNLMSLDGFQLGGGNDGWDGMTSDEITATKDALLISAFSGEIDPLIKSRFSSPCDFCLDANYSVDVKKAMASFAENRQYDCMTYLDTCLVSSTSGLVSFLSQLIGVNGFNLIKECHNYKWRDKLYTGKVCDMTITHWLSKAIPNHFSDETVGLTTPLAKDEAILTAGTDYIPGTFKPIIDPDNADIHESIYRLRGNYYETLSYRSVQRATAITTCSSNSDRLLEMNEYILNRAVAIAYQIMASKLYKLGEDEDRYRYEEDATDILNNSLGAYVNAISVSFEMTQSDKKKSLLRLVLHLTFKTVIQRGEIKIYLDPRVTDTAES